MRDLLWLLAVAADVVYGYPGKIGAYHKRQVINSNGLPMNGSFTNGTFSTGSFATGSSTGMVLTGSSSGNSLPTGTSPRGSPTRSSSTSSSVIDTSSTVSISTGPSTNSSSATLPKTTSSSTKDSVGTGFAPTGFTGTGPSTITPTTGGISTNGTVVVGIPPTGTGTSPSGKPTTSPSSTGTSSSSTSSTGISSSGTITSPAALSTISIVSVSTQSTSIAGVTSNTEITTTDDKGNHVIVPFLWGCWFCGGGGLLLWGVGPVPGIYPPPVPPPFPAWPVITIGPNSVPTPEPSKPTNNSPTSTPTTTTSSSSSSCTGSTVTDYFVSCASATSGTTSSCKTYSSSLVTGCSLTPTTTTTVSSCTAPASVDSGNLLPGEMAGAEYDFYDPRVSDSSPDWSYTVAVLASTGIVGASPGSSPSSGPTNTANATSVTHTTSTSGTSTTSTSTPSTSTSNTSKPVTTTESSPLCIPFQDPHNGDKGHCDCSSGSFTTTTPFLTSTDNPCGYTTLTVPPPSTTAPPKTTNTNPFPFTTTDTAGDVIACASSSLSYLAVAGGLTYTRCDGSSTTVSTAPPKPSPTAPPPPPPPPPPPSADCAFWDMGWGWNFEVYNIKSWSTDGGKGLHDNENGCGALTGWSWKDTDSGGQAYFNLPFFIKEGCVERAIASAGGPKISCKGQGFGKRTADVETLERRAEAAQPVAKPPNFNNATIANAYNPPDVDITAVSHAYKAATWDHQSRSLLERSELRERNLLLNKRGCIPSKQVRPAPGSPPPPAPVPVNICNPIIPGVDECAAQITAYGNVGRKVSLFYTGWGSNGAPGVGGAMARKYATKNMCNMETVSWSGLCDGNWRVDVQKAIVEPFKRPGMNSDELFALNEKADPFLKNLAQAFAETSKGDVYVFIPKGNLPGNQWNLDSAWGGWEYPALTANTKVDRILRVDLDVSDANNPTGTPQVIWDRSKGDGRANYEPKGIRGPSLPAGLPADQIPADWQQTGSS